ncbi:MAG TPA: hypothetical protein VLB44_23740 [Kofleriaceae bacterium]|nr:hypothetical protein [Kofleriaceae bacterium]
MTRLALLIAFLVACKAREVPVKPPPKDDAAVKVDAVVAIDAAVAAKVATPTKVVVGDHVSCAILSDATLWCWGKNGDGQLGTGTTTDSPKPVKLQLRGVLDVVLGTAHACALLDDHSVTCWGRINYGHKDNLLVPTAVSGVAKVKMIFAVHTASCATIDDGALVCWGDVDLRGHLRLPGATIEHRVPTPVAGLDHVKALTANGALHDDSSVSFWAADGVPVKTALSGVTEIASSGEEVCGLREDGSVACVGPSTVCAANAPQAPKKASTPKKAPAKKSPTKKKTAAKGKTKAKPKAPAVPDAPVAKIPMEVLKLPPAKHLAFDVGLCVVTRGGALQCLEASDGCKVDSPWPGLANVDTVKGYCARARDATVRCWSVDRKSRVVTAVPGMTSARDMSVSSTHACALLTDNEIVCWGSNKYGALGRGEIDDGLHREARPVAFGPQ